MLTCAVVAWSTDLVRGVGVLIYTEQYLAGMLGIALAIVFLHVPAGRGRARAGPVPWYDGLAALVAVAVGGYLAVLYPVLSVQVPLLPVRGVIPAAILVPLIIEGLRRTVGRAITLVVVGFCALALIGDVLPGALTGRPVDAVKLVYFLTWDSTAIFGVPMKIVTTVVVAFVLFGNILFRSGGSAFFTDISMVLMGRTRGGPAKISILASSLFGTISGSVVSNVVTTGVVTIPLMREGGFRADLAGAVEAVASTGGQLMPPVMGVTAFLIAEFLQIPYTEVALAALIPAVLFYAALFIQVDLEAVKRGIAPIDAARIPDPGAVLRAGWHFALPFVVLVGALFWLNYAPETAALLAAATVLATSVAFGYHGRRLHAADLVAILRATGIAVLDLFMIGAAAGIVIGALNISGLGFGLTLGLVQVASGNVLVLLVLAAIVCIVLGMGLPTLGVYVLLATLVAPSLIEMGIDPLAAHLFIFYFGMMSMITPPVCIGAFTAAAISGGDPMKTGFHAMRLGWTAFVVPFLFVFSGTLLLHGDPLDVAIDIAAALAGVWLVSAALMGYGIHALRSSGRLAYGVAGLSLLVPADAFAGAAWANAVGAAIGAAILVREIARRARTPGLNRRAS